MDPRTYFEDIGVWPKVPAGRGHKLFFSYVLGFGASLILTLTAYSLVAQHLVSVGAVISYVLILAGIQFLVQLVYFLHLGREVASREKIILLACTLFIVTILVTGSLWIMYQLNTRMTPDSMQMDQYMDSQSGI